MTNNKQFTLTLKASGLGSILRPLRSPDYDMTLLRIEQFCEEHSLEMSFITDRLASKNIEQHHCTSDRSISYNASLDEIREYDIEHLFLTKFEHTIYVPSNWLRQFIVIDIVTVIPSANGHNWIRPRQDLAGVETARKKYAEDPTYPVYFGEITRGAWKAAAQEAYRQSKKQNGFTNFVNRLFGNASK